MLTLTDEMLSKEVVEKRWPANKSGLKEAKSLVALGANGEIITVFKVRKGQLIEVPATTEKDLFGDGIHTTVFHTSVIRIMVHKPDVVPKDDPCQTICDGNGNCRQVCW